MTVFQRTGLQAAQGAFLTLRSTFRQWNECTLRSAFFPTFFRPPRLQKAKRAVAQQRCLHLKYRVFQAPPRKLPPPRAVNRFRHVHRRQGVHTGLLFQLSFHSFAGIRDGKVSGARAIRPKLITACQSLIEPSACYHLALVGNG